MRRKRYQLLSTIFEYWEYFATEIGQSRSLSVKLISGRVIMYMIRVSLPTPLQRILSMAITNSCVAGKEMPCTKDQSKYKHDNSPGNRVYRQTARLAYFKQLMLSILEYHTSELVLLSSRILGARDMTSTLNMS